MGKIRFKFFLHLLLVRASDLCCTLLHKLYTLPGSRIAEPEILQIPPDFSQSEYNRAAQDPLRKKGSGSCTEGVYMWETWRITHCPSGSKDTLLVLFWIWQTACQLKLIWRAAFQMFQMHHSDMFNTPSDVLGWQTLSLLFILTAHVYCS